ncbi:ARM repeat-containing protein [Basidiobolus meristosporus CBS 931.73]|uniref:ARM repeat-containing protein n=1 Tax=Basidiobolus meristosporus CBS 931.73 TaxID=1314790 RepID=A0A1Y1YTF5_9FUNG|nr:ARM repeat-containing protein [Basidiobolus meristosporus CBS 931.73]|eukprot:ORY01320.1 ARM repeat-containing protein [Basidiobolus meristosporus CBS 931.73]
MTTSVSPDIISQLVELLKSLVSNDNMLRSHAEDHLNTFWATQQPDMLLQALVQLIRTSDDVHLRSFSAVLLRRLSFKSLPNQSSNDNMVSPWDIVQPETRDITKKELLQSLSSETDVTVRHKLCDTIAEVVKGSLSRGEQWSEILPALFECSKSPSPDHREAAYRIFAAVPYLIADQHTDGLKGAFTTGLQDPQSVGVRVAALKASVSYMLETDAQSKNALGSLMPQMLSVLEPLYTQKDESNLTDALSVLIELGESHTKPFRPVMPQLLNFMVQIMKDSSLEDSTRQTALELLLTLAETAPGMCRKTPNFCSMIIPVALEMMTELEDDQDWYNTDDLDDEDNDENYVIGEHAMDRLARYLGGKQVLPVSFQFIPPMLGSDKWEQRHAALMAISAIGEGCAKIMEAELDKVINLVIPYLRDQHPRVRYAACNAIGQMSTDFANTLQKKFHEPILSNLVPVMDDTSCPRVQAHAAAAMVNFCEAATKKVLEPYLDTIFERLLTLLHSSKTYVQEQAITTIATVADSAEDRFVKYYSAIMPLLINVLRQATQKEYRLLRGKAMECASLIALAVGKEAFAPNAPEFIDLLVKTQESVTEADDPQISYLLAAWARVCKVLGQDFIPYLPVVMPPLLQSAQLKPDFAVLDQEDDIESQYSPEDGWEFVGVNGQQIGIKTTVLEEKCTAVEMFICYSRELGAGFSPYTEKVLEIVLPLLRFYFHDGVRQAAAATIPQLLNCAKLAQPNSEYVAKMWQLVSQKITEAILNESDPGYLIQLFIAYYESLETLGNNCMDVSQMEVFTKATVSQLEEYKNRLEAREQSKHGEDYDPEDEEIILEEEATEEAMLGELSKAIHTVLKTHGTAYLPYFEQLLPLTTQFLTLNHPGTKQWAICIFDDLVEFTGPTSFRYQGHFLQAMVQALLDTGADVRQAAAYGIGMCAQFGGADYADACFAAINPLFQLINAPNARDSENVYVTENAISAVAKVCKYNSSKFDVNTVLPAWFAALPIENDEEEAPHVYTYLLDLLDAHHPAILGANNENIPKLVTIFTDTLVAAILSTELAARMVNSLKAVLGGLSDDMRNNLWNSIDVQKRKALNDMGYL